MSIVLLHPYSTDERTKERQEPTWQRLESIQKSFPTQDLAIYHIPCSYLSSYEQSIRDLWWAAGPLMICEQDNLPTIEMLYKMASCKYHLCCQAYYIYPASEGLTGDTKHMCQSKITFDDPNMSWMQAAHLKSVPIEEGEDLCDWTGFGLCKISPWIRRQILPQGEALWKSGQTASWLGLDGVVCRWITETFHLKWHVHYPIMEHNHKVPDRHDIEFRKGRV